MIQMPQEERALKHLQGWRHGGIVLLAMLLTAVAAGPARGNARQGGPLVSIQDNRLSAALDRVPLRDVLAALAHEALFTISVKGEVETEPISISLHDVELEQGLRRLLRGTSYAMTYEAASSASASPDKPRLVELTVFGSDKAAPNSHVQDMEFQPLGTVKAMPLRNSKDAAASTPTGPPPEHHSPAPNDPGQRVETLRTLGQQRSPELETMLGSALDDPQEGVRATALEVLRKTDTAVPVEQLTRLAREDGNAHVRMDALALLADHAPESARKALEAALQDAEPTVREHAERLLEEVESLNTETRD
jgi:HEAT repeats